MNSKNWNDRADKDLFFTILSVKNIGVISGTEWITVGHHMRTLGYGFSNEGCRQHFQGLRRSQNKIEPSNGTTPGSGAASTAAAVKVDPSLNPITRRPGGPGRRRSRKLSSAAEGPDGEASNGVADSVVASADVSTGPGDAENNTQTVDTPAADIKADIDADGDADADADGDADADADLDDTKADAEGEADPDAPLGNSNHTLSAELVAAATANGLEPLLAHTHPHAHARTLQAVNNNGVVVGAMDGTGAEVAAAAALHRDHANNHNPHQHAHHQPDPALHFQHQVQQQQHQLSMEIAQQQHLAQQHHHQQQQHLQHQQHPQHDMNVEDLSGLLANEKLARQQLIQQQQLQEQQMRQHHEEQLLQQPQQLPPQHLQHQHNANGEAGGVVDMSAGLGVGVAVNVSGIGVGVGLNVHSMAPMPIVPQSNDPGVVEEDDEEDVENEDEVDVGRGQQVKRQKLQGTSLEDHAVLTALAAHNGTAFPTDFHYGEA